MFIYREDYYNRDSERLGIADILIRKHRNGPIGQLELLWHPEQLVFRSPRPSPGGPLAELGFTALGCIGYA